MNVRRILFNSIMTALIGAMLGTAVAHIGQRVDRTKVIVLGGAVLGFLGGALQETIRQQKQENESDYEESDH
jgi:hypothetical protein